MSGSQQPPPSKDGHEDRDPPAYTAGRSTLPTPTSSSATDAERRALLQDIMRRVGPMIDSIGSLPGLPDPTRYPTHQEWLHAVLAFQLQVSDEMTDHLSREEQNNNTPGNDPDDEANINQDSSSESKSSGS